MTQLLRELYGGESEGRIIRCFLTRSPVQLPMNDEDVPRCRKLDRTSDVERVQLAVSRYDFRCAFRAVGNGSWLTLYIVVRAAIVREQSSCSDSTEHIQYDQGLVRTDNIYITEDCITNLIVFWYAHWLSVIYFLFISPVNKSYSSLKTVQFFWSTHYNKYNRLFEK